MSVGYNPRLVTQGLTIAVDAANIKSHSRNVQPGGSNIGCWYTATRGDGFGSNCVVVADPTVTDSPAGGVPMKMTPSSGDPHTAAYNQQRWNIASTQPGNRWIISVYVKANVNTASDSEFYMFGANTTGSASNGVGGYWNIKSKAFRANTTWQRVSDYFDITNANSNFIQCRLDGPQTYNAGEVVWWDGWQIERVANNVTTPSAYTPPCTSAANNVVIDLMTPSGTFNPGALVSNVTTSGNNKGYVSFTGSTAGLAFGANKNMSTSNGFTIAAMVRIANTQLNTGWNYLYRQAGRPGDGGNWLELGLYGTGSASGTPDLAFKDNYGGTSLTIPKASLNFYDTWTYVVLGYTSGRLPFLYAFNQNGTYTTTSATAMSDFSSLELKFFFTPYTGSTNTLTSDMMALHVYNRAISLAEAQQNYNALRGRIAG